MMDRETFAVRQAEMTARWYQNVQRREGDVAAYIARRENAYLDRWREALRFVQDGSRLLDIGGGNLFPRMLAMLAERSLEYWYVDVDPAAVVTSRALATAAGFAPERFAEGFNDRFEHPDASFDAVFSSHCIEHSFDLAATLAELHRLLRPGGTLLLAVPLGWEVNPEHPYFFGVDEWLAMVVDAGFRLRVWQIGTEYPETGVDLFLAAERIPTSSVTRRLNPEDYRKSNFRFLDLTDPSIACFGSSTLHEDRRIMEGEAWEIRIKLPPGMREALPIFYRHDWSGVIKLTCGPVWTATDLYSSFTLAQPVRLELPTNTLTDLPPLQISPITRNGVSRSTQGVLRGIMLR